MRAAAKNVLRKLGISRELAETPYYYIPYLFWRGRARSPKTVSLELTFKCNARCEMCPQVEFFENERQERKAVVDPPPTFLQSRRSDELTTEEIKTIVDDLGELGVGRIQLTGGEAFLRRDIGAIISSICASGIDCSILTNGSLISEEAANCIVENGVRTVMFSLDGPRETHDEIRKLRGSYDKICRAAGLIGRIKKSRESAFPVLTLGCTIFSSNQDSFSEVVETAKGLGIGYISFSYLYYTDNDSESRTNEMLGIMTRNKPEDQKIGEHLRTVDIEKFTREVERTYEKAGRLGIDVQFSPPLRGEEVSRRFQDAAYTYTSKCFDPWYNSRIDAYGNVYTCNLDYVVGNVRDEPFSRLWNGIKYQEFRRRLRRQRLFPKCTKCCVLDKKHWSYLPHL
jgi:radical SAM protein with 4Fe4S-binding SPASM domain